MKDKQMRGVFAIPPAVYHEDFTVDYEGVARCVEFCLACGVHGLVIPVYATEYVLLSTEERKKILEACLRAAGGKVPVIAGVSAAYVGEAMELTAHACSVGAEAVIAAPPHALKVSRGELMDYYERINTVSDIPIFIQNLFPPLGDPMDLSFLIRLLTELEHVSYVKEETSQSRRLISALHQYETNHPSGPLKGIMGGGGSRALIEEYDRGICGTMPSCQFADLSVKIWNLLEEGDIKQAYQTFSQCLPAFLFSGAYGVGCYKKILKRRGIVKFDGCRPGGWPVMDEAAERELERVFELVKPLLEPLS
ncbi:dihydrodipicolinate synthase family protein [Clostridium sp. AM58-1XD]|uniref:dihydrodipicolinate synthase family protein n=1 Tax=Clostridium sp. AM58-1XD TaxID=2292307 RepID=UPI0015F36F58|nr:dihydrodipicolinate synthase family protein [Clostridium sp. AM58-1XD]